MNEEKTKKRDKGLMIVAGAMTLLGLGALFFNITLGIIILAVGIGMFVMGLVSKSPEKRTE